MEKEKKSIEMSEFHPPSVDGRGDGVAMVVLLLLRSLNTVTISDPKWQNEFVTDSSSFY